MVKLTDTPSNRNIVQNYINDLRNLITNSELFNYSARSRADLANLTIDHAISENDLYTAVLNLKVTDYSRGIDTSNHGDYNLCAFDVTINGVNIYLKTGIGITYPGIIIMSCHEPIRSIDKPFS